MLQWNKYWILITIGEYRFFFYDNNNSRENVDGVKCTRRAQYLVQ